ncbi:MAG: T9SS type A sorting domain-containing protein [Ignavibacteriales bacterium]|nr:T9SS type A sorting domain-containing protein [Ignavibacteriales bacterium]
MRTRFIIFTLMSILICVFTVNAQIPKITVVTDTVTVNFLINSSTVPDTLYPTSTLQVRGNRLPLTWTDLTGARAVNIGGDFWIATVKFLLNRGDTSVTAYKFFTNPKESITATDNGWESNSSDGNFSGSDIGNRRLNLGPYTGNKDTTVPLQYVNGRTTNIQFWKPYVPSADSVAVIFRINMQSDEGFSQKGQKMGVRGSMPPLSMNRTIFLTRENVHGNSGQSAYDGTNFWSGVVKFPKSAAADTIFYKFVIHLLADDSASVPLYETNIGAAPDVTPGGTNRFLLFKPTMDDTTLFWKWWQNTPIPPFSGTDVIAMTFRADLAEAITENGFAYGDTLVVRTGYNNSATGIVEKRMTRMGTSSKYTGTYNVTTKLGTALYYQYYRTPKSGEVRENYYNFSHPGAQATAEKRQIITAGTSMAVYDTIYSTTEEHRMPRFRSMKTMKQNVLVTFTCDVRPAIYQLKKGSILDAWNITNYNMSDPDSVILGGVWMNGPAVGGWDIGGAWGPDRRLKDTCKMWDDGTHGDLIAHDTIYSLQWADTTGSLVGQEFKFGIFGCDNEGGFGNNHIENVSDLNPTFTLPSQFGSIDPVRFDAWDYTTHRPVVTGVNNAQVVPLTYRLEQNYPNPFNPSTRIDYEIQSASTVSLKIFNLLGQMVGTLVNEKQEAGKHFVVFDASKLSSGIYFYQITAGNFVATKKLMFLK